MHVRLPMSVWLEGKMSTMREGKKAGGREAERRGRGWREGRR